MKPYRTKSFLLFGFALLLTPAMCDTADAGKNVVLLISDNQNKDDCGCYGNAVIKTPHIDRLAREGVRFLDAFATTASCGPSRAVVYTGLQTHANGQYGHGHGIHTYQLAPRIETVFASLRRQKYHTALLGKRHTVPDSAYPFSFDVKVSGRDVIRLGKTAKEFIEQADDEPFFLTIGFVDPHPTSIDRPGWGVNPEQSKAPTVTYDPADVIVPPYLPDQPEVREGLAGYYQQISHLDYGVGEVLRVLKETGKEDDTLVIFTSDHGTSEPGAMGNHYEPGIQVPFIVRAPKGDGGFVAANTTNQALVTLADITPTILDWTNSKGPKYSLHGRSVISVLDDSDAAGWDQVMLSHVAHEVTMYYPMRTIRDRRYKLIWNINWQSEYPLPIDTLRRATWTETIRRGDAKIGLRLIDRYLHRDEIELYDLQNDPQELNNLAGQPSHMQKQRELSQSLNQWMTETSDPWLVRHRLTMPGEDAARSSRQQFFDD
ncbi:Choline-sulfatase [Planctomycetes bacterium K23_9]|uniref:Choline-sulfatase n=2 Tax=Stieleria marina TaxID=1930275 RepID=A0A517NU28_9BACT|nr:Choline-sulfatase [Planctomycetes bacterium K23_9]